ncbi:MAG: glycosyltransferase family 39 protein [Chitinophagaceae bacterium]|nr:glycosyltransferase family 39 protein [Chitinophagaceae bacterium]
MQLQIPNQYKSSHIWWVLGVLVFMLFVRLAASPIYILDEAKNAQCAREMLQQNDWVVPTFNGELRTDKPVLHYYFMMIAYKIFGINEFAARFFSALAGFLTVLITYIFTKKFINDLTAFCAALVLVASTQFLFEFRLSVPDPYLIFFITVGLLTGFAYLQLNKFGFLLIAAISFSMATLAKGPVALALPGLCLLIWIVWKKKWTPVFSWKLLVAIVLVAVLTLPWYLAVDKATNGAWTRGFFIDHNLNRFSDPQEGHGGFFLVTLLFVIVGLLPFTSFSGEFFKKRKLLFNQELTQFSGVVVLAFILFFSIASTRLPNYAMPCYPFVAIIIGSYLSQVISGNISLEKYPFIIVFVILTLLPVAGYFAITTEVETAHIGWISFMLLVGALANLLVLLKWKEWPNYKRVIGLFAAYTLFNIIALQQVYPILYRQNPVAKTIHEVLKYNKVFAYEIYNPGYNFYLPATVNRFTNVDSLQVALIKNPSAIVITRLVYADTLKRLALHEVARHHDLFETPTTVLYVTKNRP